MISKKISKFGISENYTMSALISILEVTQSCIYMSKNHLPYWTISFAIGFGGICVHSQIISELNDTPFKYKIFFMFRVLNGIITALMTKLFIKCEMVAPTFSNVKNLYIEKSPEFNYKSLVLILLCIFFTLNCKPKNNIQEINSSKQD